MLTEAQKLDAGLDRAIDSLEGPEPTMKIITDNRWRDFTYRYDVPEAVLADQFDYLSDYDDYYFQYRGWWYHVSDFPRTDTTGDLFAAGWQGAASDTVWSGVLLAISDDGDQFKVGRYYQTSGGGS
jgi:hypothetical protein